jgi:predicted TIM-barrel fold metal-dependent hydrolase
VAGLGELLSTERDTTASPERAWREEFLPREEMPGAPPVRKVRESGDGFDTRDVLAHAARQAEERGFGDFTIVDVDAHHYETESWAEIAERIEDPVIRHLAQMGGVSKLTGQSSLIPSQVGNQDIAGRVSRYRLRGSEKVDGDVHRDVTIIKRAMQMMGIDYQIVFPTPMLNLGMHPQVEVEVAVARAYARWITEEIMSADPSIKTMLYLPFNDPVASLKLVEDFGDGPGVVGFMVTSVRYRPVHHRDYMKLYAAIAETGMPLGFHAAYNWQERSMEQLNKFLSVHALGFPFYNMIHLTNWVINGIPERFPDLRVVWIESGLAWIPFLMQRLDDEYMMRSSEAPSLTKRPSEYMREFYYTSQPMEFTGNMDALRVTFEMMDAENRLMYSSDYPHWDFDLPSKIYDLPFPSEETKRKILGGNALELFGIDDEVAVRKTDS